MWRTTLSILIVVALSCASLVGCSDDKNAPPEAEQTKTAAEYKAEAEKEITEENAAAELDKLEQTIEQEAGQEP